MGNNQTKQRNWTGLVLVVLGLVFLARNLHILPLPSFFFSWKTLLILIGVVGISLGKKEGYIPLVIGAVFILLYDILQLPYFSFRDFWPVVLILIGFALLMRHRRSSELKSADSPELDAMSICSGVEKKVTSQDFVGGKITAICGGIEVDMRQASLSPDSNVIDLFTLFGGTVFDVPADWTVNISQLTVLFGALDEKRIDTSRSDPNKVLHIKGLILFGGAEIRNS